MDTNTNSVRELTNAELDAVGGGAGGGTGLGGVLSGIEKLGGQLAGDVSHLVGSVEKQVGSFLGGFSLF